MTTLRLVPLQRSALEIYVIDPAHDEPFPAVVDGATLAFAEADRDAVWRRLMDAINSADDDGDGEMRGALERLATRVLRVKTNDL